MSEKEFDLDLLRSERVGLDEALFCAGKTVDQIARIVDTMVLANRPMLLTRLDVSRFESLDEGARAHLDFDALSRTAILGPRHAARNGMRVAVVCAGTSDLPVSRETVRTLEYYGVSVTEFNDVGVAGLHRLLGRIEDIRAHDIVIAVAGMDAALVSVLGGLVKAPMIAVPTSVGYGATRGGETALAASLASCAAGVAVVNIDNGFGAACAALRILNLRRS
ncbi:MAG: nickel pincer cofactor biosynthesis protein LarB [Vicinamibacteria bacterium]